MATNAVIGALRINLGMDSAEFQTGMKNAAREAKRFGDQLKIGLTAAAASAGAAMGAMTTAVKGAVDNMDEMSKAASKFGVPIEQLSALKHAADLSGVSMDGLGTGLRILSRNMADFAAGANNSASQAFRDLGISVTNADGSLRSTQDVMLDVAQALSTMQDGAEKTALSMAIFGRSGADLIPMLNAGRDGIRGMMDEARQLGIVFSGEAAKAAENFNDNMTRLGRVWDGLVIKVAEHLVPALDRLSQGFLAFVNNEGAVRTAAQSIAGIFENLIRIVGRLAVLIGQLRIEFTGLGQAVQLAVTGEFSKAWEVWKQADAESVRMVEAFQQRMDSLFSGSTGKGDRLPQVMSERFGAAGTAAGTVFGGNFVFAAGGTIDHWGQAVAPKMATVGAQVTDAWDGMRTAAVQYRGVQESVNVFAQQMQNTFENVGSSLTTAFSDGKLELQEVFSILKDIVMQLIRMASMAGGLGNLFSNFFNFNPTSDGFSKMIGFANGGSFAVGGAGGIDSQVVAFRATPGETVDIRKPGQDIRGGGGGGIANITVNVQGANGDQHVIDLVQQGVSQGLEGYDGALPDRIRSINANPRVR